MKKNKIIALVALLIASISWISCDTEVEPLDPAITAIEGLPVLATVPATNTTANAALSGGVIASDQGYAITQRGVVWSTTPNPTIANSKTIDGAGTGSFISSLTGLTANTTYYVKAYATNSQGTAYGNQIVVTTLAAANLPVLTTSAITNNSAPSARSGGIITADGGSPVIDRGVVWSVSPNPEVSGTRTTHDGTGIGSFTSQITPTLPGTTYYVRAYARNSNGISYGNQITFVASVGAVDNSPALMTANINGMQYDFMKPYLYGFTGNDVIVENDGAPAGETRYLKIQGDTSDTLGSLTEINLHIPNDKWVPGTYPLIEMFDLSGPSLCQANLVLPYVAGNPDFSEVTGGSVTITEFNLTTKRVKGTFTITYQKSGLPTTYQITNGTFNYGLDASYFN